jgi:hypothetical protein
MGGLLQRSLLRRLRFRSATLDAEKAVLQNVITAPTSR